MGDFTSKIFAWYCKIGNMQWVAEGSPTHSTPVRIEDPLQFVPVNTNPKEFKRVQQQVFIFKIYLIVCSSCEFVIID